MASLAGLGIIPELLYEVLGYLEAPDIFALLLTCRAFYPVCHKHLWSTIRLIHRPEKPYDICSKLVHILQTSGSQNPGLKYTKNLHIDMTGLLNTKGFSRDSLRCCIETLLKTPGLQLSRVELHYDLYTWCQKTSKYRSNRGMIYAMPVVIGMEEDLEHPDIYRSLQDLRDYSEAQKSEDFSVAVTGALDTVIVRMMDAEKITFLNLGINWGRNLCRILERAPFNEPQSEDDTDSYRDLEFSRIDEGDNDDYRYRPAYHRDTCQWNMQIAMHLTQLLAQGTNLKTLILHTFSVQPYRRYVDFKMLGALKRLQITIASLPKLETLEILDDFFHPSFFVIPPESTISVTYQGLFSDVWYKRLKGCPLTNVQVLKINHRPDQGSKSRWCRTDFRSEQIRDVKVCGLRRFEVEGVRRLDLIQCILKRNRGLEETSKRQLLEMIMSQLRASADSKLRVALSNTLDCIRDAEIESDHPIYQHMHDEDEIFISAVLNWCMGELPRAMEQSEVWLRASFQAYRFITDCEEVFNISLGIYRGMLNAEYTLKFLEPGYKAQGEVDEPLRERFRNIADGNENHDAWIVKLERFAGCFERCQENAFKKIRLLARDLAEDFVTQWMGSGELCNTDLSILESNFAQECAKKLGSRDIGST
ncbi:hypothetical protein TWF730_003571 [Orbilia blumenaviensis]|uniref:F-box domain-containing protein n=1 Tax=Orbilia blumenaviensis TaxID=1796055 RepID=A0AAV9U341_9PEZI